MADPRQERQTRAHDARAGSAMSGVARRCEPIYKQLTEKFIRDWDFDGSKLDNIYSVPPATTRRIITSRRRIR